MEVNEKRKGGGHWIAEEWDWGQLGLEKNVGKWKDGVFLYDKNTYVSYEYNKYVE